MGWQRGATKRRGGLRWESGQSAAELVAVIPLLLVVVLALAQAAIAGHAAWSAANAARAAARVAHVGGDAEEAALASLPEHLAKGAEIDDNNGVEVRVKAPALLPGVPSISLSASASLDPAAEDDGG